MLALVADSHGAVDRLETVLSRCAANGWPMAHAGDGIVDGIVPLLKKFPNVQIYWARGNADTDDDLVAEVAALKNVILSDVVTFDHEGQHFSVSHYEGEAEAMNCDTNIDVWLHGHTHRAKAERNADGSVNLNPGSLFEDAKYVIWNPEKGTGERVLFSY